MRDQDSIIEVYVLTSNKSEEDILCREEIESYLQKQGSQYRVHHALTRSNSPDLEWSGSTGRISEKLLSEYMPSVSAEALVLTCGPDGMVETVKRCLTNNGWDIEKSLVVF
jgi:nitrate reductase (NAD(P)H)